MKNVLVIYSSRIPTVEICCSVLHDFAQKVPVNIIEKQIIDVRCSDLDNADVVLAIRPFDISAHRIIMAAKKANKEVIVYLDDDLLHLPHVYSSNLRKLFTIASYKMNCDYLQDILAKCDVLWGSSKFLLNMYSPLVKEGRCALSNLSINIDKMKSPKSENDTIDILYAGSGNHYKQFNDIVIPAINLLAEKYSNIQITCIGIREKLISDCKVSLRYIPWQEFETYYQCVRKKDYDIGVAPVPNEDFYRSKYFNKYIEYSTLGVLGIYTKDYPYINIVEDGKNGLLADNNIESWKEKIEYAIVNSDKRIKMINNAQNHCATELIREKQVKEIIDELPELYKSLAKEKTKVRYRPLFLVNSARKYANRFVAAYEGIRNK